MRSTITINQSKFINEINSINLEFTFRYLGLTKIAGEWVFATPPSDNGSSTDCKEPKSETPMDTIKERTLSSLTDESWERRQGEDENDDDGAGEDDADGDAELAVGSTADGEGEKKKKKKRFPA